MKKYINYIKENESNVVQKQLVDTLMSMTFHELETIKHYNTNLDKKDIENKQNQIKRNIKTIINSVGIDYKFINYKYDGKTFLDIAIFYENDEIIEYLISLGAEKTEEYHIYMKQKTNENFSEIKNKIKTFFKPHDYTKDMVKSREDLVSVYFDEIEYFFINNKMEEINIKANYGDRIININKKMSMNDANMFNDRDHTISFLENVLKYLSSLSLEEIAELKKQHKSKEFNL